MFWWPEVAEILLCSGSLKIAQRKVLLYWVNYIGLSPPYGGLAAVWLNCSGEIDFPRLALTHRAPPVLGPESSAANGGDNVQGRSPPYGKPLIWGNVLFIVCMFTCFLSLLLIAHLFLFFPFSICSVSFSLCSFLVEKKRKQWTSSLIYLWNHSCIIQLNIQLNKVHSGGVIESNLSMLGLWFMFKISSRTTEGSFWPWTVTFAVLKETFYLCSPFNLLLAHGLAPQSSTANPVTHA